MTVSVFPGDFRIGVLNQTLTAGPRPPDSHVAPKFQVMVLLSGFQRFYLNNKAFELDATQRPIAIMMSVSRPAMLQHDQAYGAPYRKIALATSREWLHQLTAKEEALPSGLEASAATIRSHVWRPDADIIRLATQILVPPPQTSSVQTQLFRMSRGLELIRRALIPGSNAQPGTQKKTAPADAHPISERIRLYLLQNLDQTLTLPRIEKDLGMNRRSIQRHFKNGTGVTLSDFLRSERLMQARRALSEDGLSIAQAAHLAGYSTPENFSTAFRQAFGMPPQVVRNSAI